MERLMAEIKPGRSLTNYCHRQNRIYWGKFVYCQLKEIWRVRDKDKTTLPSPCPFFSWAQLHAFIPNSSTCPP